MAQFEFRLNGELVRVEATAALPVLGLLRRVLSYRALVKKTSELPVVQHVPLKQPQDYRLLGSSVPRVDVEEKVLGRAQYGLDVRLAGMLFRASSGPLCSEAA